MRYNTLLKKYPKFYPSRSSIRALTTGVGPLTTNSQYDAASITGNDRSATIVSTGILKNASIVPSMILSANVISTNKI